MAEVDSLTIEIESESSTAATHIDSLVSSLDRLKTATRGGAGLSTVSTRLKEISSAANSLSGGGADKIRAFADSLKSLQSLANVKISSSLANQLTGIGTAVRGIQWTDGDKLAALADGLRPLSELGRSNLTTFINQLGKLPNVISELDKADMGKFAAQMREAAAAIRPLADEMNKVAAGFSSFPSRIQRLIQSNSGLKASNTRTAKSFNAFGVSISGAAAKFGAYLLIFRRAASLMGDWVTSANDYIENVNLFQVAMGDIYDEAFEYAELVSDKLGIDPSEWMRNQGVFMSMAKGFGLVNDKAYQLSKGLTELSYDISSLYNEDVETAAKRLQSALAGEIEPIRRLGISITQATLQEYALSKGIDEAVTSMTEQEKALLRSLKLIEDADRIGAIGDFAKTLESPANALRVLRQQITQLGRAIGSVLIPFLIQVIPWVQAFVMVLTDAIKALAALVGFTIPEWDISSWENTDFGFGDTEEAIDGATGAAKEFKRQLMGIDELTVLQEPSSGGGAGAGGLSDWTAGLEIPEVWNERMLENIRTQAEKLKEPLKDLFDLVGKIGAGLLAWKIVDSLPSDISKLKLNLKDLGKYLAGSALVSIGVTLLVDSIRDIIVDGKLTWDRILKGMAGGAMAGAGLGLMLATKLGLSWVNGMLVGAVVGVGISLMVMGITSMVKSGVNAGNAIATAIGSVLAGGGLGAFGLSRLGFFAGEGFAIGASIVLSLTLTAINFSAISSGQWDAGGWQSVLMSAISTVAAGVGGYVLAGAVVGSAAGPVGMAIGIAVGLVINLISASIAEDSARQLRVENTFYDEQGVLIADLAEEYGNLVGALTEAQQPIVDAWAAIGSSRESIEGTITNISNLSGQVNLGYKDIQETMPLIKAEFDSLYADTIDVLNQEAELIYSALAGSAGQALIDMGYSLEQAGILIAATVNNTTTEIETLRAKNDELFESILAGTASDGAMSEYLANAQKIADLSGVDTSGLDDFRDKISNLIPEDINWETDDLTGIFEGIAASTSEATAAIEESSGAAIDALEHLKSLAVNPEDVQLFDSIITAFTADRDSKIAEVESIASEFVGGLQTNLITSVEDQVNAAMEDWDSLSWFTKVFSYGNKKETYMQEVLSDYQSNIVDPITEEMKSAFTDTLGEDTVWADTAMKGLVDNLFDTTIIYDGYTTYGITKFSDNISGEVESILTEYMGKSGAEGGKSLVDGEAKGVLDNLDTAKDAAETLGIETINSFEDKLQIGSPSKVMAERGLWITQGLKNGINENASSVYEAMKTLGTTMITTLNDAINSQKQIVRNSLENLFTGVNIKLPTFTLSGKFDLEKMTVPKVSVRWYAAGGFPAQGELFIAREAGPELVGQIGNRTAVANNDQIVQGIAAGVENANEDVVSAILAMAARLERAIQENSGSPTYFDGQLITKSQNQRNRMYGKTLQNV